MERQYISFTAAEKRIHQLNKQNRTLQMQVADLNSKIDELQTSFVNAESNSMEALRLVQAMAAQLSEQTSGFASIQTVNVNTGGQ